MSKFFGGSSGSDSASSSSSSESDSDEEVHVVQQNKGKKQWEFSDSESDSDGEVRVVKSKQDKKWEGLHNVCDQMAACMKRDDWAQVVTLNIKLEKTIATLKGEFAAQGTPRFYIRFLVSLHDNALAAKGKKLSPKSGKAANTLRQKLKKMEHLVSFDEEVAAYRANPDEEEAGESDNESSSDSDSDSDSSSGDSDNKKSSSDSDSDSDSDFKGSASDSDDDEEEDERDKLVGRARWVKKKVAVEQEKKPKLTQAEIQIQREAAAAKRRLDAAAAAAAAVQAEKALAEKLRREFTPKVLKAELNRIIADRGKAGTNDEEQIERLRRLCNRANVFSAEKLIPVLMHYISALFDRVRQIDQFLPQAVWKQCYRSLTRVVDALAEEPNIKLGTLSSDAMAAMATLMKNTKVDSSAAKKVEGDGGATQPNDDADESKSGDGTAGVVDDEVDEDGVLHVPGELAAFVLRMSSQFTKALQKTDPHTFDYVNRLEDESLFLELAEKTQAYYERQGDHNNATRLALRRMEHLYYKHDDIANALNIANIVRLRFGDRTMYHPACSSNAKALTSIDVGQVHPAAAAGYPSVETPEQLDVAGTLLRLSTYIYANGNGETKTRAMLCHVFHHALHNRYYEARDLLLMSHIGDGIANADISTQILYNRTVAVVGLCAFRLGLMEECRNCLDEFAGGRGKKLLAQGISWRHPKYNQERDIAEENAEKRRLVPYHQHLNLELLECCYLTASMLEEIPKMADGRMAAKRDVYQKRDPYQYALEEIENQVFIGPPENTREHIHAASKALRIGNWEECASFVFKLDRVWSLVPGREKVKEQLLDKIKEVALRVYLLTYSTHYDSISQDELCTIFSLEENRIHSIVSKMMISQELRARWDQPTRTIVLHQVEPTKLQNLALELATKIEDLTEMNENMLERRVVNDSRDDGSDQRGFRNNYRDQYRPISTKFGQRRNIFGRFGGGRGRGRGGRGGGNRGGRGRWGRGGRGRFGAGRR